MRNIFIIKTDKPSRLFYNAGGALLYTTYQNYNGVNLYITSDEEVRENEWCLDQDSTLFQNGNNPVSNTADYYGSMKKIILTTDEDLIAKGVQSIDEEFLQWFVKNPTCTKVEVDVVIVKPHYSYPRDGINHYNIIMPKEPTFENSIENSINIISIANSMFRKKEDTDIPVINSKWRHYNGNIYTVIELTNLHSENFDKYPITVVYKGENGKIWSRPLSDWSRSFTKFKETDNYPTNQWDIKEIEALKAYTENREQVFWKNHSIKRTGKKSEQLCRYCSSTTNWCDDFNAKTCENYLKSSDSIIKKAAEKYAIEEWEDLYNHVGLTGAERGWETITDFIAGAKSDAAKNYWFEQFEKK